MPDGRWQLPDTHAVSGEDRNWLVARRETLERSFVRCSERVVAWLVLAMFLRFPSSANAADHGERDRLYVAELRQFPQWALEAALGKVRGAFAPSLPDLVAAVTDELGGVNAELASLNRVLCADVYHVPDDAEKARVEAAYRDLLEKLEWSAPADLRPRKDRQLTRQEALQIVDEMKIEPITLPPMSDELRGLVMRDAAE